MKTTQLEIDFADRLETAETSPEKAEIKSLLDLLEQSIESKTLHTQLREAGSAIERLSGILSIKCDRTLNEWQSKWIPHEPALPDLESNANMFYQGQQLRLDHLFEESEPNFYCKSRRSAIRCGSVAVEVDRNKLADAIESEIPSLEDAVALAHSEDIEAWVEIVRLALVDRLKLTDLIEAVSLSIVQVWIALLFGGFQFERNGDFYEGEIIVWKPI